MKNNYFDFDCENFKAHFCKNQVCKFFTEEHLFLNYSECFDYHKDEDRRRKVTFIDNCFNYSPKYYYDSNDNNLSFCKNPFEYYYHPLNYKTKKCEKERCDKSYCTYFHTNEEKEDFENFRKKFKNAKIKTLFDDVTNLCNQITENLKITETPALPDEIPQIVNNYPPIVNNYNNNLPELYTKKSESISSTLVKIFFSPPPPPPQTKLNECLILEFQ